MYQQTRFGTVQTGTLCTSQEGGCARIVDFNLRFGMRPNQSGDWFDEPARPAVSYSDDLVCGNAN